MLSPYVTKVSKVHGDRHEELLRVYELFYELKKELLEHTAKEEATVFPMLMQLDSADTDKRKEMVSEITELEKEHDHAGSILKELREITSDFTPPIDACGTYRLVYKRLEALEAHTFMHVHLENNNCFRDILPKTEKTLPSLRDEVFPYNTPEKTLQMTPSTFPYNHVNIGLETQSFIPASSYNGRPGPDPRGAARPDRGPSAAGVPRRRRSWPAPRPPWWPTRRWRRCTGASPVTGGAPWCCGWPDRRRRRGVRPGAVAPAGGPTPRRARRTPLPARCQRSPDARCSGRRT